MKMMEFEETIAEVQSVVHEVCERDVQARDFLKPPALITMSGLALVLSGCKQIDTMNGVHKIAAGRSCDLLDGLTARTFHLESDAGALADAMADKIGMAAIGTAAYKHDAVPKSALFSMLGSNIMNAGFTVAVGMKSNESIRPTKTGKLGMAAYNMGIISYLYANALEKHRSDLELHPEFAKLGKVAIATGQALSVPTALQYASRLR